jgi:hypothetical protein
VAYATQEYFKQHYKKRIIMKTLNSLSTSWQTTILGVIGALGLLLTAFHAQLDSDPGTVAQWNIVVPAVIAAIGVCFARDANKTSEDSGLK